MTNELIIKEYKAQFLNTYIIISNLIYIRIGINFWSIGATNGKKYQSKFTSIRSSKACSLLILHPSPFSDKTFTLFARPFLYHSNFRIEEKSLDE